jgi:predicted helicase
MFPNPNFERENRAIAVTDIAARSAIGVLMVNHIPDLHITSSDRHQIFPFYTYNEDGSNRRENITDWALNEFRAHYNDPNIGKWDIFHYVYAVLHHPEYRERYAANLKRELPRIPFVGGTAGPSTPPEARCARDDKGVGVAAKNRGPSTPLRSAQDDTLEINAALGQDDTQAFWRFVEAGRRLAELHVNYEQQSEYPLERVEKGQLNWRVEKMRLSKDKTSLTYNEFLTLKGIPLETYEYRLGNRSALEWVIDQYQVSTDKRSGIVNDPNRADDPEYIVRLIGQVITVSLQTMKIVKGLPALVISIDSAGRKSAAG